MYTFMRYVLIVTVILAAYFAAVALYCLPYGWVVIVGLLTLTLYKKAHRSSAHGTARWADISDIPRMLEGDGLIVGHIAGRVTRRAGVKAILDPKLSSRDACRKFLMAFRRKQPKQLVRLTQAVHTAVFAPTGAGKGVSCVVPFLLTCPDSMVVYDVKAENYNLTANARRKMGHRVIVLDLYKIATKEPDTFNPILHIDRDSETALDDIRDLAAALAVKTGEEKDPHWTESAEIWIAAMIAMVVCFAEGADKSLQSVRMLLTNPDKMQAAVKIMCESNAMGGMLSRLGYQLTQFKDRELGSTLTTTNRFLRFLDTIAVAESTKQSSFNPADLLTGKCTIYLIVPPDRMRVLTGLVRLWVSSMLRAVVKGGLNQTTKVHFVLDECASLGHMDCLDDAVDKLRGYGVRLILIWQSLAQLRKVFPDGQDQNLLANTTQVFFGINDQQTAEFVSSRLGESTITTSSGGTSTGTSRQSSDDGKGSYSTSTNSNENWQFMGRKLLRPEELTALPDRVAITFAPGVRPIATWLVRYYEKDFKNRRSLGPVRAAFHTACLFIMAAILAVIVTRALVSRVNSDERRFPRSYPQIQVPLKYWSTSGK
jgi:type IV secretion system protein VirD4